MCTRRALRRSRAQRQLARNLVRRAFDGSAKNLVLGALSSQKVTAEGRAEIRSILDEYEGGRDDNSDCDLRATAGYVVGWTLLHLCWQGTLVAVGLWCVLEALGGRIRRCAMGFRALRWG